MAAAEGAAALMAAALASTPTYAWMLEAHPPSDRERLLRALLERNLALQPVGLHAYPAAYPAAGGGAVECAFILAPVSSSGLSLWAMITGGLPRIAWEMGLLATRRMLALKGWHGAAAREAAGGGRRYLCLERMAVAESSRNAGVGSAALGRVLRGVADAQGLPVVLSTQTEAAARFYARLGFATVRECEYPPGVNNWIMVREPQQQGAR
mmetsp:Transcript_31487/g.68019  ORF Transcript_31487/g.68019 Transcript_31487/m.68019 type:complete len:210 (+) Transcript_31487:57-686(+)